MKTAELISKTRKSSYVNARGIPPAVYWVLLLLSYLATPWAGYPPWQGTPQQGTPWQGTPQQGTPPAGYPPSWTWQGTPPWLDLAGYPPFCPMAFWEMLQSIMDMGTPSPLWTDRWKDRHLSKHYLPVVLRTRAVITAFHWTKTKRI